MSRYKVGDVFKVKQSIHTFHYLTLSAGEVIVNNYFQEVQVCDVLEFETKSIFTNCHMKQKDDYYETIPICKLWKD